MSGAELAGDACRVGDSRKSLSLQPSALLGEEATGIFMHTRAGRVFPTQSNTLRFEPALSFHRHRATFMRVLKVFYVWACFFGGGHRVRRVHHTLQASHLSTDSVKLTRKFPSKNRLGKLLQQGGTHHQVKLRLHVGVCRATQQKTRCTCFSCALT